MNSDTKFNLMSNFDEKKSSVQNDIIPILNESVKNNIHTILTGPPGTGKTRTILNFLDSIRSNLGNHEIIQFPALVHA